MSTLFNLTIPIHAKPKSKHPWQDTIKDILSNRIKHAHNSVRNPVYPKLKEKVPDADRVKFSVIGDRCTKEFIYCVNIVKGLYKYRWKKFEAPFIRGVTTVDWPEVWRSLKIQYGGFAHCLKSKVAILINDKFLGGENELKDLIETKYIYHLVLDYCNEAIANFACYIRCSGRSCAFMHIAINDEPIGTLIFMLYSDIVPYTCENFLRLCRDTKGGYSGTPIHRIVKDGWVQGGGFGLKKTELDCENFIVPHDKRGVLGMANDDRHVDCSTQFFILLQPAPWMAHKYVAFGQLIEGNETLNKIENVPTWYESPMSNITIYKAGIFNMECHDIMINRGANEYISGHIEDLNALGEILYEALIERVYLEVELRMVERLRKELMGEQEQEAEETDDGAGQLRATQRFRRKKDEMESQIRSQSKNTTQSQSRTGGKPSRDHSARSRTNNLKGVSSTKSHVAHSQSDSDNKEFDVEQYEPEETDYKHVSLVTLSLIVKPEKPYYIPLTDVPYPGEIDSIYNLRKFLRGHYCLESDIAPDIPKKTVPAQNELSFPSEVFDFFDLEIDDDESASSNSLDSDDEKEIREYLRENVDRVSFAGGIIKAIIGRGIGKYNLFEGARKSELINDDQLRRLRLASVDVRARIDQEKKVSISVPHDGERSTKIKRRQTGFVRPEDLEKIHLFKSDLELGDGDREEEEKKHDDDDADEGAGSRKVRIAPPTAAASSAPPPRALRRPTGYVRPSEIVDSDTDVPRQSVLQRLYEEVSYDDDQGPTLKDYRPMSETHPKGMMLTFSPNARIKSDDGSRDRFLRHSMTKEEPPSFEHIMNLQHSKKMARKISTDYVNTIDQIEHKTETSLRSIEFAKTRPSMRVSEYQMKNKEHKQQELMKVSQVHMKIKGTISQMSTISTTGRKKSSGHGLRLPGDSPIYSTEEMHDSKKGNIEE